MISPALLVVIFIAACSEWQLPSYGSVPYPPWAHTIGWVLTLVSVVQIPLWLVIMSLVSLMEGGSWSTFYPTQSWLERRKDANETFIFKPNQSMCSMESCIKPPFIFTNDNMVDDPDSTSVSTLPLPPSDTDQVLYCSTARKVDMESQPAVCLTGPPGYDRAMSYQYFNED